MDGGARPTGRAELEDPMRPSDGHRDHSATVPTPTSVQLQVIGVVRSPFTERFGTPRQATVAGRGQEGPDALGRIELDPRLIPAAALEDLAGFDRIWVLSWMHLNNPNWNPKVRVPRGPRVKRSVLATRAPHRPNNIALSALRLIRVEGCTLHVQGVDLLDGTPVLDIKPYIPYADAFPDAATGWLEAIEASGEDEQQSPDLRPR